jgi:D-alanyl-D-alanine carboxypeptidase/D-alanyl-D-alanine-endopeptidase (penicillin-binding protein 4)
MIPSGDPTFGSWRWESTKAENVIQRLKISTKGQNQKFSGPVIIHAKGWNDEIIPDGWIWQDIGNYYGAGAAVLNWRENQYDLLLKSGKKIGDPVEIIGTDPELYSLMFNSIVQSAAKGTGDNAYIYLPAGANSPANVRGTIPVNESKFKISGAIQNPAYEFVETVIDSMKAFFESPPYLSSITVYDSILSDVKIFHVETSPSLDSIIYWFNKKSINLYGEALVKTFAYEKQRLGSTDSGVAILREFWEEKGISKHELNMADGSGLSPLNRVTTHAQVEILKYAKTRDWYPYFYNSLPDYNGMKMKSGTISGVKGFCGYHKAKDGKEYIFSFLVNNYNGSASGVVSKMYRVLDVLK